MSWEYDEEEAVVSNGVYINPKDVENHLLLIWSIGYLPPGQAPTKFNDQADCVVVDVVDLDQTDEQTGLPGLLATGQRWYQQRIIRDLKGRVGKPFPMLAFLATEPSTKGNPAFVLTPAHTAPTCIAQANEWRSRNPSFIPGAARQTMVDTPAPAANPQPKVETSPASPQSAVLAQLRQKAQSQQAAISRLTGKPQEIEPPF
jgi:hypothetical protein